jgi:hypothetical protein
MREFKVEGDVGGIKIENLPTSVPKWIDAGFAKFNLNRCPRCPDALLYDAGVLLSVEKVTQCWAIVKATRDCQGGALLREAIQYQSAGLLAEARKTLETIRDHVAYDIPYVHQLIAFLAGMQNDHPAKALAMKRLEEFGPEFALHPELWLEELARTQVSLLATFGLLKSDTRRER